MGDGLSVKRAVWFLALLLLVGAGAGGAYLTDRLVLQPKREQQRRIEELEKRKRELEGVVERLKQTQRRAHITVLDQKIEPNGFTTTTFRFTELDGNGNPSGKGIERTIIGEEIYFDGLAIKFEDRFAEEGDALRGKTLLLFRRVFSNKINPDSGYPLDERNVAPEVYAAQTAPSEFERNLWRRFWALADDAKEAAAHGVRAVHGVAPYIKPRMGGVYVLEIRATGEITIRPVNRSAEKDAAP
jgi:hypothetical protein